jgi:hypothetical protein
MFKRILATLCSALLTLVFSGCASFNRIADYPTPTKSTVVAVVDKPMSKMSELPVGAFYDKDRQIIVTGHQKGMFAGMMFGVVGVLVADQMNKSSAAGKYGDDSAKSGVDLVTLERACVDQALKSAAATNWSLGEAGAGLRLSPYAVFTVEKSGEARLYAMLRAEIPGPDGNPTWSARYFVRAPGLHKLDGDDTWMTGGRFGPAMQAALQRATEVCIADTHGKLSGTTTLTAKGRYPYINTDFELRVIAVQEDADSIIGRLAVGDAMVLAGTHVLDRKDYEIKPASFKDPRK